MAYKKYIQVNGKTYGPYTYHSKRVDGKVISEYYGSKKNNGRKFLFISFGILLFAVLIYFLAFSNKTLSGEAVLGIDTSYEAEKPLEGVLEFSLKEGELIPESSKIVFENSGNTQEFALNEVLSESLSEGKYYAYGKELLGEGSGYGIEGEREIYPELKFTLQIYSESEDEENEEVAEENTTEASEIIPEEVASLEEESTETQPESYSEDTENTEESSTSPITGNSVSNSKKGIFSLTGMISMELQDEIEGTVSKDEPFVYELKEGEKAELKLKSVNADGEEVNDNLISLKIEGNKVIVTTDYSEIEKGYGKDYIGDKEETISLDLSKLNLFLEEGNLTIKLIYGEEEIIQLSTILEEGEEASYETVIEEEEVNEEEGDLNGSVMEEEKNITEANQTILNETIIFSFEDIGDSLTSEEREALIKEFGNITLVNTKSELSNGMIGIYCNLSKSDKFLEHYYDSSLSKENLDKQMERDRIIFLKDIANSLLKKEIASEGINSINETYTF